MNSKEEILKMETGVELDILVSELVMNNKIYDREWPCGTHECAELYASSEKPTKHPFIYNKLYPVIIQEYTDIEGESGVSYWPILAFSSDYKAAMDLLKLDWFRNKGLLNSIKGFAIVDFDKNANFSVIVDEIDPALAIAKAAVITKLSD